MRLVPVPLCRPAPAPSGTRPAPQAAAPTDPGDPKVLAAAAAKFAPPNKTRIVRKVGTDIKSLTVPVADVTSGDKSKDVALQADDVVSIPQTLF